MEPWHATRESVKRALDVQETARSNWQIDEALAAASRTVEKRLHRRFYPWTGTRTFDWPNQQYARPWRLWLDENELVSVSSLTVAGQVLAPGDYLLRPDSGPPYSHVEINLASSAAFGGGPTHQRNIAIAGVWAGCELNEAAAGQLAEALDATKTAIDVTDGAAVGIGDLLRVGDERMIVTGRTMLDTGQTTGVDLTSQNSATSVAVANGAAYSVDEVVLIDGERMLIVDIAGNTLVVKRAWDGSVLAAHTTGARIYAPRTLTVVRGAVGSTPAAHSLGAVVARHLPPGPISALTRALALVQVSGEQAGYARTMRTGQSDRSVSVSRSIDDLWTAVAPYRRSARIRAV